MRLVIANRNLELNTPDMMAHGLSAPVPKHWDCTSLYVDLLSATILADLSGKISACYSKII